MQNTRTFSSRMGAFDGLRGFCAIYVVLFHVLSNHPDFHSLNTFSRGLVTVGFEMVPLFFVLSGFFVSRSLASLQSDRSNSPFSAQVAFLIRRAARLIPLWILLLVFLLWRDRIKPDVFLANAVFYFGDLKLGSKWLPIVPAWSLQAEVIFYCTAGLFLRNISGLSKSGLLVGWVVSLLGASLWRHITTTILELDDVQASWFFPNQIPYFVAGVTIERIKASGFTLRSYIGEWRLRTLELSILFLFLLKRVSSAFILPTEVLAPAIVFFCSEPAGLLDRFFRLTWLRFAGTISFGIYILQNEAADLSIRVFGFQSNIWLQGFYCLGSTVLLAVLTYFGVEKWITNAAVRFTR